MSVLFILKKGASVQDVFIYDFKITSDVLKNKVNLSMNMFSFSVGVVGSIKEYGISKADWDTKLDSLAQNAKNDTCTLFNPRKPEFEEIKVICQACFEGKSISI